jgi:Putative Actinobacterial Holin-X, holin superfamily III
MSDRLIGNVPGADASVSESLPALVGRLGDDLTQLVDSKLSLLKIELQEDLRWYARSGARAIGGGVVAAVGVALLSVGAAFFVSALLRQVAGIGVSAAYSLGFASVGLLFLVVGATVALRAARKLTAGEPGVEHTAQAPDGSRESLRPGRV